MKVLLDTNVILDVILKRQPWFADSKAVWDAHCQQRLEALLAATTLTNLFYILRREIGTRKSRIATRACLKTFGILPVTSADLWDADGLPGADFEDNLEIACAQRASLDAIVTRDASGFSASPIPVMTPTELLAKLVR